MVVVVLPTPPFWLATASVLLISIHRSRGRAQSWHGGNLTQCVADWLGAVYPSEVQGRLCVLKPREQVRVPEVCAVNRFSIWCRLMVDAWRDGREFRSSGYGG